MTTRRSATLLSYLLYLLLLLAAFSAKATDWDPKFRIETSSSTNWYVTAVAYGPGTQGDGNGGYNKHTTNTSVVNSVALEILNADGSVSKKYDCGYNGWYGIYWTSGLDGVASGTLVRLVATTNDGKSARSKPFKYLVEQPVLESSGSSPILTLAPTTVSAAPGQAVTFAATVANANGATVRWSILETNCGTITANGTYTSPTTPTTKTCHVQASITGTSVTATATVTITRSAQPTLRLTPTAVTVASGQSTTFSAAVANANGATVVWSIQEANCGTITANGLYTAPTTTTAKTCHVRASITGSTVGATATVSVTAAASAPQISAFSASPATIMPGASSTLTAVFTNGTAVIMPGNISVTSNQAVKVSPSTTTTYTLTVTNSVGATARNATVTVNQGTAVKNWVTSYYVGYQRSLYPPESIDWSGLTHIVMSRIKANPDGTLNTDFDIGDSGALARQVSALAHQNGKKAILMLGGAQQGAAIRSAVQNHRAQFVSRLVQAMNDYGYDGLDIDWEDYIDWDLFVLFARDLRAALPNAILTMPGGAININFDVVEPRLVEVIKNMDQFNLMTYYPSTSWAGSGWLSWHNSPLTGVKPTTPVSIEESFNRYVLAGVPKEKLGMGIAFYATCYSGSVTAPNQSTENGVEIRGGDNDYPLSELFGSSGAYVESARKWDSVALGSYLSLSQPERHGCRYVTFEDEKSILEKGKFARTNGFGGIIVWTVNQGYVGAHSEPNFLTQALRKAFIEPNLVLPVGISVKPKTPWITPGSSSQLNVLVTGTEDKRVTWSVQTPNCGTIDANGRYTAPANTGTCIVLATSTADPTKTTTATVNVSNETWEPGIHLIKMNTCWIQLYAEDITTQSVSIEWNGTVNPMQSWGTYLGKPNFASNLCINTGASVWLNITSSQGRTARKLVTIPAITSGY